MKKNKIGIFGIGAIGSVISLTLSDLENDIYYYNRSPKSEIRIAHKNRIAKRKITLTHIIKENHQELDWLIICLKEYQYKGAEEQLKFLIKPGTKIAVIRNGINLKNAIINYTSEERIIECMIDSPIQINENGDYHQLKKPMMTIKKAKLSQEFKELFIEDKIDIIQVENYKTKNWEKLIESSALGGILSLSGESCWIFKDAKIVQLYENIVDEGIKVAKADGAKIENKFKSILLKKLLEYPETKESSMLIDRRKGNPIELNAKNGVISQLGKKHGIETEVNDLICLLLKYTNQKKKEVVHNNT